MKKIWIVLVLAFLCLFLWPRPADSSEISMDLKSEGRVKDVLSADMQARFSTYYDELDLAFSPEDCSYITETKLYTMRQGNKAIGDVSIKCKYFLTSNGRYMDSVRAVVIPESVNHTFSWSVSGFSDGQTAVKADLLYQHGSDKNSLQITEWDISFADHQMVVSIRPQEDESSPAHGFPLESEGFILYNNSLNHETDSQLIYSETTAA